MRHIPIDLADLAEAFDNGSAEASFYLDIETGAVVLVMAEMRAIMEDLMTDLGSSAPSQEDLAVALAGTNMPEWETDAVLEAYDVEMGYGERYLGIPKSDSHTAYGDMEDFIATVRDSALQERLQWAIRGRGAFRRFKDELRERPREEQRWFLFRDERTEQRMREWLASLGVEPI